MNFLGVVGVLVLVGCGSLSGQQITPMRFHAWEPVTSERVTALEPAQDTTALRRRDYRYEGLAFGGIGLGAAGAWVGWNVAHACPTIPGARCEPDRLGNAVAAGLAGAAVGGGLGYLIGRLSAKPSPNQLTAADPPAKPLLPDSTRRRVGYHHWKGAAIGAGGGALLGGLLALLVSTGCSDCDVTGSAVVKTSLITAGLGGAFGFLVGSATPKYE